MDPVFKKMNFKNQSEICVLNAPESFKANLEAMQDQMLVKTMTRSFAITEEGKEKTGK